MSEEKEKKLRKADEVFIYMHRIFRASRNLRAHWYIDHIDRTISIQKVPQIPTQYHDDQDDEDRKLEEDDEFDEYESEMVVVGIVPEGSDGKEIVGDEEFLVTTSTKCTFISRYYRIVFVLDLSPSVIVADDESNCTLVDRIIPTFRNGLRSSVKSFTIPGTDHVFRPQVFTSVCIFCPFKRFEDEFTLCQGVFVTESNVEDVVEKVSKSFVEIFERLFTFSRPILEQWGKLKRRHKHNKFDSLCESESQSDENLRRDRRETPAPLIDDKYSRNCELPENANIMTMKRGIWTATEKQEETKATFAGSKSYLLPEWSLIFMLRMGLIHIQMLPENTQSNLVIISDSVCGMPDEGALQAILTQLRSYTVAFSFIQLQKKACTEPVFGHVGSSQLFHFMTLATFGTYLPRTEAPPPCNPLKLWRNEEGQLQVMRAVEFDPIIDESPDNINMFHRALICWSFEKALADNDYLLDTFAQINRDFLLLQQSNVDRHRKFVASYEATLNRMMYVRLREGFTLKSTVFIKNNSRVVLTLRLAFRPLVFVDYIITTNWPVNRYQHQIVNVELVLEGPYNELKDLLTESDYLNPRRMNLIKSVIDGIIDADRLLLHIHSFDTMAAYYTIPKGVTNEHPLFQSGERTWNVLPQLCIVRPDGHKTRGFVNFWKRMLDVQDNNWQKWVHTQTERGILHLIHTPFELFTTDRLLKFDLRYPLNSVHYAVKVRSTFCLVENQAYVTLIFDTSRKDDKPCYFFLRKISSEGPVVTVKTAFLGGVTSKERRMAVSRLRQRLINVTFGTAMKEENLVEDARRYRYEANAEKMFMDPLKIYEQRKNPAVTIFRRPLERLVIRYTHAPIDLTTIVRCEEVCDDRDEIILITLHNALAKILSVRRNIIILNVFEEGGAYIVRLLADFCQNVIMHKRLQEEKYRPAWTTNNAVSLIRQVYDSSGPSLEQFIMFPSIIIQPDIKNEPILKRKTPHDNKAKYRKNGMPSKSAVETLAIVCEQWSEPEGGDPNDQLGNKSSERRLNEDLRFISIIFTLDKIIRFSGECGENGTMDRILANTTGPGCSHLSYADRCRCTDIHELTGLPKRTLLSDEEVDRLMYVRSKSRKRSEKLKTDSCRQKEKVFLKRGPFEAPKPPTLGVLPVRFFPKKPPGDEDLLDELDKPYPGVYSEEELYSYAKDIPIPTVTDIHAESVSPFVTVYSNLFSLTNLLLHAQRKYLPLYNFVRDGKDEDMPRCNSLQLNALHCQLSEVADLTWPVDRTEMDVVWADLMKTIPEEKRPQQTDLRIYVKTLTARMISLMIAPVIAPFEPTSKLIPFFLMTVHETQIAHCYAQNAFDENQIVNLPMSEVQEKWDSGARFGWTPNNRNVFPEDVTTFTSFVKHFEEELLPRIRMRSMYEAAQEGVELSENSLLDMGGEVESMDIEMITVPAALAKVCKHRMDDVVPEKGEICCKGSNVGHMFIKMLTRSFLRVNGTDNIFFLDPRVIAEHKAVEERAPTKLKKKKRPRRSSLLMFVGGESDNSENEDEVEAVLGEAGEMKLSLGSEQSYTDDSQASSSDSDDSVPEPVDVKEETTVKHVGEYYEEYSGENQPMFIEFNCTVTYEGAMESFPINFLPTCVHTLLEMAGITSTTPEAVREATISLDMVVITTLGLRPTVDAATTNERMMRMAKTRLRNPYEFERERRDSYRKEAEDLEEDYELEGVERREKGDVFELPPAERKVINDVIKSVCVILELEKVLTESRSDRIDEAQIWYVIRYIDDACKTSGKIGHVEFREKPFLLVDTFKKPQFLASLDGRVSGYMKLRRWGDTSIFYCRGIEDQELFEKTKQRRLEEKAWRLEMGEEVDDEGDEDVLTDFWLIISIGQNDSVIWAHFCQRFANQHTAMLDQLWAEIRQDLRVINQNSLLVKMHTQRMCDLLMVPDFRRPIEFEENGEVKKKEVAVVVSKREARAVEEQKPESSQRDKKGPILKMEENLETQMLPSDMYYYFHEAYFSCPVQKELWIPIPERMRNSSSVQYRNPLTIGFEKMKLGVQEFGVHNRTNTYVYKDLEQDQILYFQVLMDPDHYEIATMGSKARLRKTPREVVIKKLETKVCLLVFSIEKPRDAVVEMIRSMLVERLDTQLLGDIMRGYVANLEQPLLPSEVAFLQPEELPPSRTFFSIPSTFQDFSSSLLYYIGQHMEALPCISPAKVKDKGIFYNGAAFMKIPIVDQIRNRVPIKKSVSLVDNKSDSKGESKIESKSESKIESKSESKIETKIESKSESKIDSKIDSKTNEPIDQGVEAKEDMTEKPTEESEEPALTACDFFRSHPPIKGDLPDDYALSSFFVYHILPAQGVVDTGIALLELRFVEPDGRLVTKFDQPSMNEQTHILLVPNVLDDKATVYRDIIKSQALKMPMEKTTCGYLEVVAWTKGSVSEEALEKMIHELLERSMFDVITEFGYLNTQVVEEGTVTGHIAFTSRTSEVFLQPQDSLGTEPKMSKQGSTSSMNAHLETRSQAGPSASGEIRRSLAPTGSIDASIQPTHSKSTVGRMPSILKEIEQLTSENRSKRSSLRRQDYINRNNAYSIIKWLDFVASKQGETNSVVKHRIRFEFQHASLPALFEIRNRLEISLGGLQESIIRERIFLCGLRKPPDVECVIGTSLRESSLSIFGSGCHDMRFEVLTTDPFHAMTEDCGVDESQSQDEYILISCIQNVFEGYGENMLRTKVQVEEMKQLFRNHLHGKYNPLVQTNMYCPRQRIMMAYLKGDFMTIYFYNYHKNIHTDAVDCANKIVGFHNAKSRLLREIGLHKMGITHLSPFHTEPNHEYDYEVLIWTDPTTLISKEFPGDHKPPPTFMREPQCSNIFFRMYRQPDLQETMGRSKTLFRSECVRTMHYEQMLRWRSGLKNRLDFIQKITRAHFEMTKKNTTIFEQDLLLFLRPPKVQARKLGPPPTHTSSSSSVRHRFSHFDDDAHTEDNGSMTERTSKRASVYGESLKSQAIFESEIFKGKGEFVKKTELKLGLAATKFHEIRTPFFLRSDWNTTLPRRTGELFDEVVRESDIRMLLEEPLKEFQEIVEVQKAKANKQLLKRKYSEKNTEVVNVSDMVVKYMEVEDGPEDVEREEEEWSEDDSDLEEEVKSEALSNNDEESVRSNSELGNPQAIGDEKFERTYGKVRRAWIPNPPCSPAPFDSRHNSISSTSSSVRPSESGLIEKMLSSTLNAASKLTRRLSRRVTMDKEHSIDKAEDALQDPTLHPGSLPEHNEDPAVIETAISPIMYKHAEEFANYFTRKYGFLQFHVEHLNRRSKSLNRYSTSSTMFNDLPYLVFYKAFDGGVIFADLKYEVPEFVVSFHMYERAKWSSADYYMIEQMSALYRKESEELHTVANQLKLQDSVCFMTFNFDYHLRAVASYLESLATPKPCVFGRLNAFHVIERLLDFYQLDLILSKNLVAMKYQHMTKEHSDALLANLDEDPDGEWKEIHVKMESDPVTENRYAGTPIQDAICRISESHLYKSKVPVTTIEMSGIIGKSSKMRARVVPCMRLRVHMDDIGDGELWPPAEHREFIQQFEGKQRRRIIDNLSKYGVENVPTPWEDSFVRRTVREVLRE